MRRVGFFCIFLVFILIAISTYWAFNPPQEHVVDLYKSAQGACQIVIKRFANDPDSIEFPRSSQNKIIPGKNGLMIVKMTFRGKNQLGATVLSHATCYLISEGEVWKVLDVR
jgi:hypothetical protein